MMEHQQAGNDDDLTRLLPEDVLAQVLSLLAPRDLAASRCVCGEWKGAIDGRRLLRADLLPLSVGGIFLNLTDLWYAEFFRPGSGSGSGSSGTTSGNLTHLYPCIEGRWFGGTVKDHCNGLLLLHSCVANPETGWFAPLPPWPEPRKFHCHRAHYLVFDPTGAAVSSSSSSSQLHYSVFIIDYAPLYEKELARDEDEWPPSPYLLHVLSSRTGRWEERPFLRQGEAAGTIADVRLRRRSFLEERFFAAYWKQDLYVHCHNDLFLRISLSKDEYRVIKPPAGVSINSTRKPQNALVFGKSEKGPCLAQMVYHDRISFKVWILDESEHETSEWVLRHCNKHLGMMLPRCYLDDNKQVCGPWILEEINYNEVRKTCTDTSYADYMDAIMCTSQKGQAAAAPGEFDFTLDSSSSSSSSATDEDDHGTTSCIYIDRGFWVIGFHPYKENIVFLASEKKRTLGLAYDMNSSKFQYLGNIFPTPFYLHSHDDWQDFEETFVYTPCKFDP